MAIGKELPLAFYTSVGAELTHYEVNVAEDGRLTFVGKYDVETGGETQFWTGVIELP